MIKRILILAILVVITIVVSVALIVGAPGSRLDEVQRLEAYNGAGMLVKIIVFGISSFLGIDILKMIKMTKALPPGKYERIKYWRYLASAITLIIIGVLALALKYIDAGFWCIGAFVVIGFQVISGLTYNKAVTT